MKIRGVNSTLGGVSRLLLGIPLLWSIFWNWISYQGPVSEIPTAEMAGKARKHPLIPILDDYTKPPNERFWVNFPSRDLPVKVKSSLNTVALEALIEERKQLLTQAEVNRAKRAVRYLSEGAPSCQKTVLPAVYCRNAASTYSYGPELTDTIAEWVSKGFVAGPFSCPPLPNFRVNPLMVVPQKGKVRPCLNVSSPSGKSFNDNIHEPSMEKVYMSSPQKFSYSVLEAGKNGLMTKFDMKDAYKNVPCRIEDLRLQGFEWCGKYFVELAQIFGAKSSVPNYDTLGNTTKVLAKAVCEIPRHLVHRQLDDVPTVAPATSGWCEAFTEEYKKVCSKINISLAEECPKKDKAFCNSTRGKVLGIEFDTITQSWNLPEDKCTEYANLIVEALSGESMSLLESQKLLGKLSFVSSMAPWARSFLRPLQLFSTNIEESNMSACPIPYEVRRDLQFWWKFITSGDSVPIAHPTGAPPLLHLSFTTDAAGWKEDGSSLEVGLGCVGLDEEGRINFANQTLWYPEDVLSFFDMKGKYMGNKTTTLEFSGILIPFMLCPELVNTRHVVIGVDNISCLYAWERGYSKEDNTASVLVRTLVLLSAKLSCVVHMKHVPRDTTWESKLADRLSRKKTTQLSDRKLLSQFKLPRLPEAFRTWMRKPSEDWDLPNKIVNN